MLHIGVDFSITSPCICFWNSSKTHCFENSEFFFLGSSKKTNFPENISFAESSFSKDNSVRFSEMPNSFWPKLKKDLTNVSDML